MHHVKTAISLEQPLFEQLAQRALSMKISRSQLLALALAEYLERQYNRDLLARLNDAYADGLDETEVTELRFARNRHRQIVESES